MHAVAPLERLLLIPITINLDLLMIAEQHGWNAFQCQQLLLVVQIYTDQSR